MAASPGSRKGPVRFRERAELLDFLLEVSTLTQETLDLDRLLDNVAGIIKDVIPVDLFAILLYSERSQGLRIRYSIGHREEVVRNLVVRLGEGVTGAAAQERTATLVGDVRSDPRYLNALDAVRSELAVPMLARGKLVGVLDLQSTRLNAYTEQDRALVRLIASRIGSAIDNARLYRRVERQNRTLRTLATLSQEFSSILALDELLGKIAKTVKALIDFDAFSVFLVDEKRAVLSHRFSERYDKRVALDDIPLGKGITGAAAESREPVRVADTQADPRYIPSHPGIRSECAIPLILQDRVMGVLDVESERMGYFTDEHVRMLSLLAPQIASSIENARLYSELAERQTMIDQDLRAARKLQSVLQPKRAPELPGLEIAIKARPAREISGDVYDFFEHGDDYSLIAFGDVSGKGAAAALYGALVSGLLRILAPRRRSPAMLLKALNESLLERKVDAVYATLLVALWERRSGRITLCNAGAEPPLVLRNGEILKPRVAGVPIGLLEDIEYEELGFDVGRGDLVLFHSDGVEDQDNPAREHFGEDRIRRALLEYGPAGPDQLAARLFADLDAFRGPAQLFDDQSVVVLKVTG